MLELIALKGRSCPKDVGRAVLRWAWKHQYAETLAAVSSSGGAVAGFKPLEVLALLQDNWARHKVPGGGRSAP